MPRAPAAALLVLLALPSAAAQDRPNNNPPPRGGLGPNNAGAPFAERVDLAIDDGVFWLRAQTRADGSFGRLDGGVSYAGTAESYDYPAGPTALALYALLKCGVPPGDPVIEKGFAFLRKKHEVPTTSYEISALVLALEARSNPFKRERTRERRADPKAGSLRVKLPAADAAWMKALLEQLVRRRQYRGGWRYNMATPPDTGPIGKDVRFNEDMSSTQLAMLAFSAGERCGFRQPDALYEETLEWVLGMQAKDGPPVARFQPGAKKEGAGETSTTGTVDHARGWAYHHASPEATESAVTGSMTACGLANIAITTGTLRARKSKALDAKTIERAERGWWDGMAWIQKNWAADRNPSSVWHHTYWLYCAERVGDLRGIHLLGGHDWYTEGATVLLDAQYPKGFWFDQTGYCPCDLFGTCFALLFLERATVAVTGDE